MKILVIGSTGPQGREFVAQALAAGHAVCAFARNPAALQPAPGLEVLRGDVFEQHSLDAAARGQDAAVSMLGVSFAAARKSPPTSFLKARGTSIAALKAAFAASSSRARSVSGTADATPGYSSACSTPCSCEGPTPTRSCRRSRRSVRSGLDFTIVRPTRLTTATGSGRYTAPVALAPSLRRLREPTSPASSWMNSAPAGTSARPSPSGGRTSSSILTLEIISGGLVGLLRTISGRQNVG